jgi:hypothetical protein
VRPTRARALARPPVAANNGAMANDPLDEHWIIMAALLFILAMAVYAALGFEP